MPAPGAHTLGPRLPASHDAAQVAPPQSASVLHDEQTPAPDGPRAHMPELHSASEIHCSESSREAGGMHVIGTASTGDNGADTPQT